SGQWRAHGSASSLPRAAGTGAQGEREVVCHPSPVPWGGAPRERRPQPLGNLWYNVAISGWLVAFAQEHVVAKKQKEIRETKIERPKRARLSAKESLKRMEEFGKRKEQFIAAVRKNKNRGVSP